MARVARERGRADGVRNVLGPRNGGVSYWYAEIGLPEYRPALPHSVEADVAIVGAGFTGLWTA